MLLFSRKDIQRLFSLTKVCSSPMALHKAHQLWWFLSLYGYRYWTYINTGLQILPSKLREYFRVAKLSRGAVAKWVIYVRVSVWFIGHLGLRPIYNTVANSWWFVKGLLYEMAITRNWRINRDKTVRSRPCILYLALFGSSAALSTSQIRKTSFGRDFFHNSHFSARSCHCRA